MSGKYVSNARQEDVSFGKFQPFESYIRSYILNKFHEDKEQQRKVATDIKEIGGLPTSSFDTLVILSYASERGKFEEVSDRIKEFVVNQDLYQIGDSKKSLDEITTCHNLLRTNGKMKISLSEKGYEQLIGFKNQLYDQLDVPNELRNSVNEIGQYKPLVIKKSRDNPTVRKLYDLMAHNTGN